MKLSVFYDHIYQASRQTGKSVNEICQIISECGISYIEIEDKQLLEDKSNILSILKNNGMSISCIYGFFDFGHDKDINKGIAFVDLADSLGVKNIMPIPGFKSKLDGMPVLYQKLLHNMKDVLEEICEYAHRHAIHVCLEDFDDSIAPFSTIKGLKWFMENVKGLTCAFDTGNFLYSEEDAGEAFTQLKSYITHVHCKDRSLKVKEGEDPKMTVKGRPLYSSAVGYGCIPMEKIVNQLLTDGYDGIFAIEHFGSLNQLQDIKKSAEWLISHE